MMLRAKGYEEFLPTCSVRKKRISYEAPLFPGYVFCRVNANVYGLIVTTPGVIRIAEFGGKPAPIDPEEIHSIQVLTNSGSPLFVWKGLTVGDKVRVEEGPWQGVEETFSSFLPKQRFFLPKSLMMRIFGGEVAP